METDYGRMSLIALECVGRGFPRYANYGRMRGRCARWGMFPSQRRHSRAFALNEHTSIAMLRGPDWWWSGYFTPTRHRNSFRVGRPSASQRMVAYGYF